MERGQIICQQIF